MEWSLQKRTLIGQHVLEYKRLWAERRRDWLHAFLFEYFELHNPSKKEIAALKSKVRRCVDTYTASKEASSSYLFGKVGRGRGHATGWRTNHVPSNVRKRLRGGGRKAKSEEIGFCLYQFLVDTVDNLCCRLTRGMLPCTLA